MKRTELKTLIREELLKEAHATKPSDFKGAHIHNVYWLSSTNSWVIDTDRGDF